MANLTQHLTSISPDLRTGPSPGRRLLALVLCAMLAISSVLPGAAMAGEVDSEGEGTVSPVEVPVAPDFDPGGEEAGLVETPATGGGEEGGAVEIESEVDIAAPPTEEVTSATAEAPVEAAPQPVSAPEPIVAGAPESEPVQQTASEQPVSEPVANQSITAPKRTPVERPTASESVLPGQAAPPTELAEEPPPSPQPAALPADSGRSLAGKDSYVVRPGDCLWHIAAALLPAGAGPVEVEREIERLWRLNQDRIGTADPNLIYAGTELRLR